MLSVIIVLLVCRFYSYQRLLQTISVLEAQRTQAILDLEALARHQKQALANPVAFVDQLQKQVRHRDFGCRYLRGLTVLQGFWRLL